MTRAEQRRLLGQFIRSHRERMVPDSPTGRRRTPGLRREELAARAGIGATWCAWIEQGRDVSVSPEALARLAVALALTSAERAYLFELGGRRDPSAPQPFLASDTLASQRALVDAVCHPAYGLDRLWNACCWNAPAERLFAGWLGKGREKNLLRYAFTEPAARTLLPDWENRVTRLLAEFRADYGRSLNDPCTRALVDELKAESELFTRAWDLQDVVAREGGTRSFSHPDSGLVTYQQYTFSPADRPDHKVVVLIPVSGQHNHLPLSTTSI
jgi:transcriptional regulator with XRE-family HTH domain